ncbi:MAG: hypothetical protein A2W95_18850 [Bacteroidetes bacterium GWA2_40_14]|nr:MAG: hypothetical protein A2W95_18850 [Bacteroidetes bacterium GWA2_40_14]HAZ03966.1 hypothetical protein [Marinilabiliales bacterium]
MKTALLIITLSVLNFVSFGQLTLSDLEQTIKKSKTDHIKALIHVTGGQLFVTGGATELALVKLTYSKDEWDPTISFAEDQNVGKLTVMAKMKEEDNNIEDNNICRIQLNSGLHYSLGVVLGAGLADADFSGMNVSKALFRLGVGSFKVNLSNTSVPLLKVEAGIGEALFDLSGGWKNDLSATINAGIGQMHLVVPANVGVKVTVKGFLGSVETPGFRKVGKEYTNALYGKTKHNLEFDITGAVGTVVVTEK